MAQSGGTSPGFSIAAEFIFFRRIFIGFLLPVEEIKLKTGHSAE